MRTDFQFSIHALRRNRTHAVTFIGGIALLMLPIVVNGYSSAEFMVNKHWFVKFFVTGSLLSIVLVPWIVAVLWLIKIARCYVDYLWAKGNGLYLGTTRDLYRYRLLPVQFVLVALVLGLGFAFRIHPFSIGFILIVLAVPWLLFYEGGTRGSTLLAAQLSDISRAYLSKGPDLMNMIGLSGSRVLKSNFARRVLVVPCANDGRFLQGLAAHRDVIQIRFLPSCGVVKLILDELPGRRPGYANLEGPVDTSRGVFSIQEVIERWPEGERLRWHGVLSDGTNLVRNEGVLHVISPSFDVFRTYVALLTIFGHTMGVSEYQLLVGDNVIAKVCAPAGPDSLGGSSDEI